MKRANTAKRIVLGLLGTVALTSFILFILDAYRVNQVVSHLPVQAVQPSASGTKQAEPSSVSGTAQAGQPEQPSASSTIQAAQPSASNAKQAEQSSASYATPQADSHPNGNTNTKDGQAAGKNRNTFQTVLQDYFSDALFIGDSRTVGMFQSHLLPEATYYAKTGIGIGDILSERIVNEGGTMMSVADALHRHSFGKVYIMIGINDIARGDVGWFTEQYQKILETVRETQPEAVIYIQGNIPMSYRTQDLNGALNNKNLMLRNEASRALADAENIFYLDVQEIYADENGNLNPGYTTDGLHVNTDYYPLWVDYLLHHAVVR